MNGQVRSHYKTLIVTTCDRILARMNDSIILSFK